MKRDLALGVLVVFSVIMIVGLITISNQKTVPYGDSGMKQFASEQEFLDFMKDSQNSVGSFSRTFAGGMNDVMTMTAAPQVLESVAKESDGSESSAGDYSSTNVQVEGVDEADIVKSDGKYIYVVSGNKVVILDAYPAEDMEIVSEINFSNYISDIYINGDKLIVFGNEQIVSSEDGEKEITEIAVNNKMGVAYDMYYPRYNYQPAVFIYDVSERDEPVLENTIVLDGNYVDSRMIGDYVYVVSNKYANIDVSPPIYYVNGIEKAVAFEDVYYSGGFYGGGYQFTSVGAIDINSGDFESETYLLGVSDTMYVSENNIYLSQLRGMDYDDYNEMLIKDVYMEILPSSYDDEIEEIMDSEEQWKRERGFEDLVEEYTDSLSGDEMKEFGERAEKLMNDFLEKISKMEMTSIYKIELDELDVNYVKSGSFPGRLLNQFSMDEYNGYLRVAATTGDTWRETSLNHVYVLDKDLEIVGSIEDLAKGERIYSVRFMGERAYMVTFVQVDPLFVIDLSNPKKPEVLGELKITGYSDYLHPYDENHLIGIGKEADEKGFYQGVKISLFDVTNVSNPVEVSKIEIGDRGTNSEALYDHKAILFDKEKNLLVLPIELYEDEESNGGVPSSVRSYGSFAWHGVYVFDINLNRIAKRGEISHMSESYYDDKGDDYYWNRDYNNMIKRSLYMDDVLYTISMNKVKANDLEDLDEIEEVVISEDDEGMYPLVY